MYGTLTSIDELPVDFFPLDSDVISMELDKFSRYLFMSQTLKGIACHQFLQIYSQDLYVDNEINSLHQIAHGLMSLQSLYGIFPNVVGKGRHARNVFELMTRMRRDIGVDCDPPMSPLFDTLMIIDRTVASML